MLLAGVSIASDLLIELSTMFNVRLSVKTSNGSILYGVVFLILTLSLAGCGGESINDAMMRRAKQRAAAREADEAAEAAKAAGSTSPVCVRNIPLAR